MSKFKSVFDSVKQRNKIYCIESSASTQHLLAHLKHHVIESIRSQANKTFISKFNILCFNSNVAKWCVSSVACTNDYLIAAEDWLLHIQPTGTCNFLAAIISGMREHADHALCIIVCTEPDQPLSEIMDLFAALGHRSDIHIRLFVYGGEDSTEIQKAYNMYHAIVVENNGTFGLIKFDKTGNIVVIDSEYNKMVHSEVSVTDTSMDDTAYSDAMKNIGRRNEDELERVIPGVYKNKYTGEPYPMCIYPYTIGNHLPFDFWKRIIPSESYFECLKQIHQTNESNLANDKFSKIASSLISGRRVLARNIHDGFYYVGMVKDQVKPNIFNVVFGPYDVPSKEYLGTDYQETKLSDIIDYDDALKRSLMPGDRVMAPDPNFSRHGFDRLRYITGTLLDGYAARDNRFASHFQKVMSIKDNETDLQNIPTTSETLVIELTHPINKTIRISSDNVIFVPEPFFQRLTLESAMPRKARETLHKVPNYPENSLPGYPTSGKHRQPLAYTFTQPNAIKGRNLQVDYLMPPFSLPLYPITDLIFKDEKFDSASIKNEWLLNQPNSKFLDEINKEDLVVPDSMYTIKELKLKIHDQLEAFKTQTINNKTYYLRKSHKDNMPSKKSKTMQSRLVKNKSKEDLFGRRTSAIQENKSVSIRLSNLEDYQQDIKEIIRRHRSSEVPSFDSITYNQTANTLVTNTPMPTVEKPLDKSINNHRFEAIVSPHSFHVKQKSENNCKNNNSQVVLVDPINDLGANDRSKEAEETKKLERRNRQINQRLQLETERFCDNERKKDEHTEYKRCLAADRLYKENEKRQVEYETIDKVQQLKQCLNNEVENKVGIIESTVTSKPKTIEDIEKRKIDRMREARIQRDNEKKERDEAALRYIESVEEARKNRADTRWWQAQNSMKKEIPES